MTSQWLASTVTTKQALYVLLPLNLLSIPLSSTSSLPFSHSQPRFHPITFSFFSLFSLLAPSLSSPSSPSLFSHPFFPPPSHCLLRSCLFSICPSFYLPSIFPSTSFLLLLSLLGFLQPPSLVSHSSLLLFPSSLQANLNKLRGRGSMTCKCIHSGWKNRNAEYY